MQNRPTIGSFWTCLAWVLASSFVSAVEAGELSDLEILRRADQARGNMAGVSWNVRIDSNEKGSVQTQDMFVQARGFDVMATSTEPPKYKGSKILMVNKNMWFYKKGISKPVPISQRQKLQGLAAYGDIPATNYAEDYASRRLAGETVDGEQCWVFDLTAKDKKKTTYDKIRYWITRSRFTGIRAEFFTVSGKSIKKARMTFDNQVTLDGKPQPFISEIDFKDVLRPKITTTMTFSSPEIKPIASYVFNLNLMTR